MAGVRNGIHLDSIHNKKLMKRITQTLVFYFSNFQFSCSCCETTVWNSSTISPEALLDSWAYKGDYNQDKNSQYWKNNALLLGNAKGYPRYVSKTEGVERGTWSLLLYLKCEGRIVPPVSMMGGIYDKNSPLDDLKSIRVIETFLSGFLHKNLYNPKRREVCLCGVEIKTAQA